MNKIKLTKNDKNIIKLYNTTLLTSPAIAQKCGYTTANGGYTRRLCWLRANGFLNDHRERTKEINRLTHSVREPEDCASTDPNYIKAHTMLGATGKSSESVTPAITALVGRLKYGKPISQTRKLIIPRIPKSILRHRSFKRLNREDAVLLISDIHIGAITKSRNSTNTHEIFEHLLDNIIKVKAYLTGYEIETLHIMVLGDILTGELIFAGQPYETDMPVIDQWEVSLKELGTIIRAMCEIFPKVKVYTVVGNHGRISMEHNPKTNWEQFLYISLRDHKDLAGIKNLEFNVGEEFFQNVMIRGWDCMIQHGHEVGGGYMGVPQTSIYRSSSRWQQSLSGHDIFCCGHYHTAINDEFNGTEIFVNGTALSDDPYVLTKMKLQSSTNQWFFGISDKFKTTWRFKISTATHGLLDEMRDQKRKKDMFRRMMNR